MELTVKYPSFFIENFSILFFFFFFLCVCGGGGGGGGRGGGEGGGRDYNCQKQTMFGT